MFVNLCRSTNRFYSSDFGDKTRRKSFCASGGGRLWGCPKEKSEAERIEAKTDFHQSGQTGWECRTRWSRTEHETGQVIHSFVISFFINLSLDFSSELLLDWRTGLIRLLNVSWVVRIRAPCLNKRFWLNY